MNDDSPLRSSDPCPMCAGITAVQAQTESPDGTWRCVRCGRVAAVDEKPVETVDSLRARLREQEAEIARLKAIERATREYVKVEPIGPAPGCGCRTCTIRHVLIGALAAKGSESNANSTS